MIDRFTHAALLFDFYGMLLTGKQKQLIEMYFMNDLSLSEIGDELGISRQAACILIGKAEKKLSDFEDKLGLIRKHEEGRAKAAEALETLRYIRGLEQTDKNIKTKIDSIINNILEEYPRGV